MVEEPARLRAGGADVHGQVDRARRAGGGAVRRRRPPVATPARRTLLPIAAVAVCLALFPACGSETGGTAYRNADNEFSFTHDATRFSEGKQLTTVDLFRRAHDEIGLQPSTVFWFGETDSPTDGERYDNGFFVAVFDTPPDIAGTDIWDIPGAQVEQVVAEVNRALPGCRVEVPARVRLGGLKGYFTTFTLSLDGQQYRGWWILAVGDIHTYEVVAQARTQDWEDLRAALAQVFWTFRPDAGADVGL